jgi:hypothetical protein
MSQFGPKIRPQYIGVRFTAYTARSRHGGKYANHRRVLGSVSVLLGNFTKFIIIIKTKNHLKIGKP